MEGGWGRERGFIFGLLLLTARYVMYLVRYGGGGEVGEGGKRGEGPGVCRGIRADC